MRVSQSEMDRSHDRIVEGASRLFRKRGIETTSVNDVMNTAGLTHGGFYRHFDSKESLVGAALEYAFDEVLQMIERRYRDLGFKKGSKDYFKHYLSQDHLKHPEQGCPISALGLDVTRAPASVQESFSKGFNQTVDKLALAGNGTAEENRTAAIQKLCMLAGAVMIARATDAETASSIVHACKQA